MCIRDSLKNVRALDGSLSLTYRRESDGYTLTVEASEGLRVCLRLQNGQRAEGLAQDGLLPEGGCVLRVYNA